MGVLRPRMHPPRHVAKNTALPTSRDGLHAQARQSHSSESTAPQNPQVYKQKVKHLLYEHQNNISTLKADGELALRLAADEARRREGGMAADKRCLKRELREQVGAGRPCRGPGYSRARCRCGRFYPLTWAAAAGFATEHAKVAACSVGIM